MAQHSQIPKFGNWETEEHIPYTTYFDKARKSKSGDGKLINPNDPQEYRDAFSAKEPSAHAPPFRSKADPNVQTQIAATKLKHERWSSREDGEVRRSTDSAARHDPMSRRAASDSPHHRDRGVNSGDTPRRGNRISGGSDHSWEYSPLHPHYQAKIANKDGVSSPSWERKGSSERGHGLAPNTPGRSRLRPARGDETPERSAAVPKFGEWDETNPASADGYTHIFNKVREEKQVGSAKVPVMPTESAYHNGQMQDNANHLESTTCWCFGFSKKRL